MKYIQVGEKINKRRKENGLTAEGLADICEVTAAMIHHVEAGRRSMSLDLLIRLCNALEVTADYLLHEQFTFERHPGKNGLYKRLDALTPKQLDLLNEMITVVLAHID